MLISAEQRDHLAIDLASGVIVLRDELDTLNIPPETRQEVARLVQETIFEIRATASVVGRINDLILLDFVKDCITVLFRQRRIAVPPGHLDVPSMDELLNRDDESQENRPPGHERAPQD